MVLESTVSIAKPGVNSVRATIPEGIVDFLELKVGDKLEWKMEMQNNARLAVVTKKQTTDLQKPRLDYVRPKRAKKID
jgi:antitoxin component of MazEF toxin-antitoxin module